jgi:hypothetical protein
LFLQPVTHLTIFSPSLFHPAYLLQYQDSTINMKFFTIAAVSFSLGSQVLAAPIDIAAVVAPVDGVANQVETLPTEAIAAAAAVPGVSTLTGTVNSVTADAGLSIVKKSISITTITASISSLQSLIAPELSAICKSLHPWD